MKCARPLVAIVAYFLPAVIAGAQDRGTIHEGVTWLGSARQADPSVLDMLSEISPPTDNNNLVVLHHRVHYQLSEDEVSRSSTRIYKYNDQEAVRDYGTLRTSFDAIKHKIDIVRAMVVDSNGDFHVVDPATVQVVPSDTYDIFSDVKHVMLPMHGVDVGSVAILSEVVTADRKKDIAPWGIIIYEQFGVPQGKVEISIAWDSPELRPQWNSELEGMTCTESSAASLYCEAVDVPSYALDDHMYVDDEAPQFVATDTTGWQDISDWYAQLFSSALSGDSSIASKAAELSDGLDDETEILKSIHEFVSNQVRYVGLEHGDFAYRPHATGLTLQRRYGDCKDKAALMVDLLRHAGIRMSPVLVSTTRRNPDKLVVPTVRYFDHLIVCGELANGRHYCLDGTDPYTGIAQLSDWIQGAVALEVGDAAMPTSLPLDEHRYSLHEDIRLNLNAAGEVEEQGTVSYHGAYGSNLRRYLAGLTPAERHDWARDDYHNSVSSLADPEFRIDGVETANDDLSVEWKAGFGRLVDPDGDLDYVDDAAWLDQVIGFMLTENDAYAYRFPGIRFDSIVTIDIADKWSIDQWSPEIDMQSRFGRLERGLEAHGQQLIVRTRFEAPAAVIAVDDIADFSQFLEIVQAENQWRVIGSLQ